MLTAFLAQTSDATFWMPKQASTVSPDVDGLFGFIYWLCVFFFIMVLLMVVIFTVKYRHRPGAPAQTSPAGHSTALELTWTIIPTLLVLVIFYYGFRGFMDMQVEPPNPYEINVVGKMWNWTYEYPGGFISDELHIPKGVPVRFVLRSDDVIHSFFIPEFRTKRDVVPGRYNRYWVKATDLSPNGGKDPWDIFCAEYCGANHSVMRSKIWVHEKPDFDKWLAIASDPYKTKSPIDVGKEYYNKRGCATCHSTEAGVVIQGPSFRNLFGSKVPIQGQGEVLADENYIRESILYPQAKIHAGFGPIMPSFLGQFTDRDVDSIIWFMKSISENYKGDLGPGSVIGGGTTTKPTTGTPTPNIQPGTPASPAQGVPPRVTTPPVGGGTLGTSGGQPNASGAASGAAATKPGPATQGPPGTAPQPPKPTTGQPDPIPTPGPGTKDQKK